MDANLPNEKRATEYLANERTFLAWIRTSISVISLGFVVAKFNVWMRELAFRIDPTAHISSTGLSLPIGIAMMAFGGILALTGAWRYNSVNKAIELGNVRGNKKLVLIITFALVLLSTVMIVSMLLTAEHF